MGFFSTQNAKLGLFGGRIFSQCKWPSIDHSWAVAKGSLKCYECKQLWLIITFDCSRSLIVFSTNSDIWSDKWLWDTPETRRQWLLWIQKLLQSFYYCKNCDSIRIAISKPCISVSPVRRNNYITHIITLINKSQ